MFIHMTKRRLAIAGAALAVAAALSAPASAQNGGVTVDVNGNPIDIYPAPIVQAGRVFVPLRSVFQNLGASVVYDSGQINATGDGHTISLQIGSTQAEVDGQSQAIDVAPFIVGASTYVPLRFISQALGASVNYDDSDRVVSITNNYQAYQQPPSQPYGYSYDNYVSQAPPPLPGYEQPPPPEPGYEWQPGYWGWGGAGYYWVPGTWVAPPQPNVYWTPPFWAFIGGIFGFHAGYWGPQVGFYGGVNYGNGYSGNGFQGGQWLDGGYRYNSAVTNVNTTNTTITNNTYVNKTVVVNNYGPSGQSYNGGPGGLQARPTASQLVVDRSTHIPPTEVQVAHARTAAEDRSLLATSNGGKPPVLVVARPLSAENKPANVEPVTEEDKAAAQKLVAPAPAAHFVPRAPAAPANHAPAAPEHPVVPERAAPERPAPAVHPAAPAVHTPVPAERALTAPRTTPRPYVAPRPAAPVHPYVAPVTHPAPVQHPYVAPVHPAAPVRPPVPARPAAPAPVVHHPAPRPQVVPPHPAPKAPPEKPKDTPKP